MGRPRNNELGLYGDYEKLSNKLDNVLTQLSTIQSEHKKEIKQLKKENQRLVNELNSTIKSLQLSLEKSEQKNQKLLLEIERLKNNNNKNSNNSSKPTSTNGYKKVINNREKSNKSKGGQKGHKGTTLTKEDIDAMIESGEIDEVIEVEENKNESNKELTPIIIYEYDVRIKRVLIKHITYPNKPTNILKSPVYYGNNIKVISNILGMKYMSMDGIKYFISEITKGKVNLSKGTLYSWKKEISNALSESEYERIKKELLNSLVLHVDETPIKIDGKQYYIHSISNDTHTLQYVNKKRGEEAIKEFGFLEKYQGILVHDHFTMYYNYGVDNAECNVHILRYLNGVCDFTSHRWAKEMKDLLLEAKERKEELIRQMNDCMSNEEYNSYKDRYLDLIELGRSEYKEDYKTNAYKEDEIKLLNRMEKYVHNHLLFLEKFYVPFSNNQAESDVRHAKIIQKIGKFRSLDGANNYVITRSCYSTYQKNKVSIYYSLMNLVNNNPVLI